MKMFKKLNLQSVMLLTVQILKEREEREGEKKGVFSDCQSIKNKFHVKLL